MRGTGHSSGSPPLRREAYHLDLDRAGGNCYDRDMGVIVRIVEEPL